MTTDEQMKMIRDLSLEFMRIDRRMKGFAGYEGTYLETSAELDEVYDSLAQLKRYEN